MRGTVHNPGGMQYRGQVTSTKFEAGAGALWDMGQRKLLISVQRTITFSITLSHHNFKY